MWETKTVLVSLSLSLLVAATFFFYQAHREKSGTPLRNQSLCKIEYRKFCLNGGESNYLVDEDIVGCNCTSLYG